MDIAPLQDLGVLGLSALAINIAVRLVKGDSVLPFVGPKARPFLAIGLGAAQGTIDAIALGTPWQTAIPKGLAAGGIAIILHELGIESLRDGKEFFGTKATEGTQ